MQKLMKNAISISTGLLLLAIATTPLSAQEGEAAIWEYDPYQVRVWIAVDEASILPTSFVDEIATRVVWSAEQVDLSGWIVDAQPAPQEWRHVILQSMEELEQLMPEEEEEVAELLTGDKLIFISVRTVGNQFKITGREVDCRTRIWGPIIHEETWHRSMLPHLVYQTVSNAFVPLLRIEDVNTERGTAIARVRAGGFHTAGSFGSDANTEPISPVWVSHNDVFMPMIRRTTRSGGTASGGIRLVDWTFLTVTSRDGVMLFCDIHSATRAPLGGRSSKRTEKLALVVRPQATTTRIILESRDKPPVRLPGYQVLSKLPGAQESTDLGKTDWQGSMVIERGDYPLQILYVKSGSRNLARLPVVAGFFPELTAAMFNDSVRRRAEGIMRGLETEFMIVVAKRELLATRIRMRLTKGDLPNAEKLFREMRDLPTMDEFQAKIDSQERSLTTNDSREQAKIETMFNQLRKLVTEHLNRDVVGPLRTEIEDYKKNVSP